MRPAVVVATGIERLWSERDAGPVPVADRTGGMHRAFEALAMDALLFQRVAKQRARSVDEAFHHSVLLRAARRTEPMRAQRKGSGRSVARGGRNAGM